MKEGVCLDPLSFSGLGGSGPVSLARRDDIIMSLKDWGEKGQIEALAFISIINNIYKGFQELVNHIDDFYKRVYNAVSQLRANSRIEGFNCSDYMNYVSEISYLSIKFVMDLPEYRVIPSLIYIRNVSYEFFKLLLNDLCYHISRLEDTRSSLKRIVAEIIAVSQADDSSGVVKDSSCLDRVISVAIAVLALSGLHVRRLMESLIV